MMPHVGIMHGNVAIPDGAFRISGHANQRTARRSQWVVVGLLASDKIAGSGGLEGISGDGSRAGLIGDGSMFGILGAGEQLGITGIGKIVGIIGDGEDC
jgi:hypothetical protein